MKIEFRNVMPAPLIDYSIGENSVWKKKFELDFPNFYLLNAGSGKGKSTFINVLFGTRFDYSGDIFLDNKNIKELRLNDWINLRKNKISVVFQDLQLLGDLTVIENLTLKNELTNHKTLSEIESMLTKLGIGEKKHQSCKTLSLGQQQRVAIIRSVLQPFELILLDEPFSHLDVINTQSALNLIHEECKKNNAGMIMTSLGDKHNFNFDKELFL